METVNLLLDNPIVLLALLFVGGVVGIAIERVTSASERAKKRAYWQGRNSAKGKVVAFRKDKATIPLKGTPERATHDAAEQLRCVMEAEFSARPLLNQKERRLLACLDKALAEETPGWRAMGQVSLGEILASPDNDAFFAVNSKRVDLLIVDDECRPLHAIEFQGKGHHTGANTAGRDAVKKEALRRAGIGYVEVVSGDTPAEVREIVRKLVGRVPA
jgi:hypothetical protein